MECKLHYHSAKKKKKPDFFRTIPVPHSRLAWRGPGGPAVIALRPCRNTVATQSDNHARVFIFLLKKKKHGVPPTVSLSVILAVVRAPFFNSCGGGRGGKGGERERELGNRFGSCTSSGLVAPRKNKRNCFHVKTTNLFSAIFSSACSVLTTNNRMTAMMSSMAVGAEPASSGTTVVNFVCHHCKQPLKLDASINDLDVETFRQLSNFAASGEPQEQAPSSAPAAPSDESVKRIVVARKAEDTIEPPLIRPSLMGDDDVVPAAPRPHDGNVNDSFVLVPLSASEKQKRNLNHRIKVAAKLFDVLSSSAQVDHPLCEDVSRPRRVKEII